MSSGRTHSLVSSIASGITVGAMITLDHSIVDSIAVGLGCLSGIVLTPDMDIDHPIVSDSIIESDWGYIPAKLWRLYWTPYSKAIPHRHFISHFPIVSTLIRVLYISLIPILFMTLMGIELQLNPLVLKWIIGLCISDTLHWLFDLI